LEFCSISSNFFRASSSVSGLRQKQMEAPSNPLSLYWRCQIGLYFMKISKISMQHCLLTPDEDSRRFSFVRPG
jgi:hypothetical protein